MEQNKDLLITKEHWKANRLIEYLMNRVEASLLFCGVWFSAWFFSEYISHNDKVANVFIWIIFGYVILMVIDYFYNKKWGDL